MALTSDKQHIARIKLGKASVYFLWDVTIMADERKAETQKKSTMDRIKKRKKSFDFERIGKATKKNADDLQAIKGIGPYSEEKLNALGIFTYEQLANFDRKTEDEVNDAIEHYKGRIRRDEWVKQAQDIIGAKAKADEEALKAAEEAQAKAEAEAKEAEEAEAKKKAEEEAKEKKTYIFEYEPKLWVDLGSALEMEMEKKIENEENDDDHNDVYQDKDDDDKDNDSETFIAHDSGIQSTAELETKSTQVSPTTRVDQYLQYEPRTYESDGVDLEHVLNSKKLELFLKSCEPYVEECLKENESYDILRTEIESLMI